MKVLYYLNKRYCVMLIPIYFAVTSAAGGINFIFLETPILWSEKPFPWFSKYAITFQWLLCFLIWLHSKNYLNWTSLYKYHKSQTNTIKTTFQLDPNTWKWVFSQESTDFIQRLFINTLLNEHSKFREFFIPFLYTRRTKSCSNTLQ